jgi:hypothetical protein
METALLYILRDLGLWNRLDLDAAQRMSQTIGRDPAAMHRLRP